MLFFLNTLLTYDVHTRLSLYPILVYELTVGRGLLEMLKRCNFHKSFSLTALQFSNLVSYNFSWAQTVLINCFFMIDFQMVGNSVF